MNELRELFPKPRLSPFFAARLCARLPRPAVTPVWIYLYWAGVIFFAVFALARIHWPSWAPLAAVPAGFAMAFASRRGVLRLLAPFLR